MVINTKIINNIKLRIIFLFVLAFIPRITSLGGHSVFVDEIIWMSRSKDVYAAVRTMSWSPYNAVWWLIPGVAEPIGLPMTFLGGLSITFLSSGYSHYSLNIAKDFVAARLPAVVLGSLFIPFFYFLSKKFIGDRLAFIASLLLALDPIAIATSRWLHQDTPLMVFSTLSILLYLYSRRKAATIGSAFLAAMAILTKPQGFLIIPVLAIVSVIAVLTKQKAHFKILSVWIGLTAFFTILLFPYLWGNPAGNMLKYLSVQAANVSGGNLTIFNGQVTFNPPWYYYFAIFPFRLPESILIGFLAGLAITFAKLKRNILKNGFLQASLIYTILFVAVISFSDKKLGIRYLLGVWPYVYIIAAYGLIYLEKLIGKPFRKIFWLLTFLFPVWGIIKFYPSYYLFYNHLITPAKYQSLEAVGYCDSVKPAIEYLGPNLFHGVKIMLPGCDAAINYYTGFTINRVESVSAHPDYIILENLTAQKLPAITDDIRNAKYREIKEIDFRGLILAKIYQKP
jgi:hypothetical protein